MKKIIMLMIIILAAGFSGCFWDDIIRSDEVVKPVPQPKISGRKFLEYTDATQKIDALWEKTSDASIQANNYGVYFYKNDVINQQDDSIVRINEKGEQVWKVAAESSCLERKGVIEENKLWMVTEKGIYGINLDNGAIEYQKEMVIKKRSSNDEYLNGNIYYIGKENEKYYLYEWNIEKSEIIRKLDISDDGKIIIYGTALKIDNGLLYYCTYSTYEEKKSGEIVAIELGSWKEKWRYKLPEGKSYYSETTYAYEYAGSSDGEFVIKNEKIVYCTDHGLICLNKNDGTKIWSLISPFDIKNTEGTPRINGNMAFDEEMKRIYYVANNSDLNSNDIFEPEWREGNIYCVEIETGKRAWYNGVRWSLWGTPAVRNGVAYIPLTGGMMAMDAETGKPLSVYRRFGADVCNVFFIGETGFMAEDSGIKAFKPLK